MRGAGSLHCFQSDKEIEEEVFQGVDARYDREANLGPGRDHSLTTQLIGAQSLLANVSAANGSEGQERPSREPAINLVRTNGR